MAFIIMVVTAVMPLSLSSSLTLLLSAVADRHFLDIVVVSDALVEDGLFEGYLVAIFNGNSSNYQQQQIL